MMGKITLSIISIISIILLSIASWVSCSSSVTPSSTRSARSGSTTSSSSSTADDDEDVEECSDRESCEDECGKIYDAYAEQNECEDLDIDEVVDLGRVYNALHNGRPSDLENISDETDDVDKSMFGDYLEIGLSGWIRQIRCWRGDGVANSPCQNIQKDKLNNTLKWLVDEEDVAGILKDHDDESKVIKELLLKPTARNEDDISDVTLACGGSDRKTRTKGIDASNKIQICIDGTDGNKKEITLDSESDYKTYTGLSGTYFGSNRNIFIYSSLSKDKGGTDVFNMAYNLLDRVCDNINSGDNTDKEVACRRNLLCWSYYKSGENDDDIDGDLEKLMEEHESSLEKSGESNFNNCTPQDFAGYLD